MEGSWIIGPLGNGGEEFGEVGSADVSLPTTVIEPVDKGRYAACCQHRFQVIAPDISHAQNFMRLPAPQEVGHELLQSGWFVRVGKYDVDHVFQPQHGQAFVDAGERGVGEEQAQRSTFQTCEETVQTNRCAHRHGAGGYCGAASNKRFFEDCWPHVMFRK